MKDSEKLLIKKLHEQLADKRGPKKTYCPSEVARELDAKNWRQHLENVRSVADQLIAENRLDVLQNGRIIGKKACEASGPIRLRKK